MTLQMQWMFQLELACIRACVCSSHTHTHTHTHTFDHAHFLNGISTYYSMQHCSVHSIRFSSSLFSMFLIFYVLSSLSYHFSIFSYLLTYLLTFHHFFRSFNISVSLSRRFSFRGDLCSLFFFFFFSIFLTSSRVEIQEMETRTIEWILFHVFLHISPSLVRLPGRCLPQFTE